MGPAGTALEISASDSERSALAKRFGFLDLPALSARVTVDQRGGGQVVVEGRLRGTIVQACILTLDPVIQYLDEADDAHRLGILREAGPVYQFRHAKLHDHLARIYATYT